MTNNGYLRQPTVCADVVAFACEDDVWTVPAAGGVARRLTATLGECTTPRFNPDGTTIAFVANSEGHQEVFAMPAAGGPARRLTYLGSDVCQLSGWTPDGSEVLFVSDARSPFMRHTEVYAAPIAGGAPRMLDLGHATAISLSAGGGIVLGLNAADPARWKRYHGGTAGDIWVDAQGSGTFRRLIALRGNAVWPMWLGDRIFFLSDHEGVGNLYSVTSTGADLRRHTEHVDYYVRFPSTDGRRIAYTAGGQIYLFDPSSNVSRLIEIETPTNSPQRERRFVEIAPHLEHFAPSPLGDQLALIARGQPFTMPHWEEAVVNHGAGSAVRHRLSEWLSDNKRIVTIDDATGRERVRVHDVAAPAPAPSAAAKSNHAAEHDLGRVTELVASPTADVVAIANHRSELLTLDLGKNELKTIDRSVAGPLADIAWSPDGRWIAYAASPVTDSYIIRVADAKSGEVHDVTDAVRVDRAPAWDPDGNYLYFLSYRDFNPVYDALQFDLGFPHSMRPFLIALRADVRSPFVPKPKPIAEDETARKRREETEHPSAPPRVRIDFEGITRRIIGFPVEEGRYDQIAGVKGRAVYTKFPVKGSLRPPGVHVDVIETDGTLLAYDFEEQRAGRLAENVSDMRVAADHRTLVYRSGERLRVIDALGDLDSEEQIKDEPGRRTGWIDLGRASVQLEPLQEWSQMYREAWRLQREQFWDEQMTSVDWQLVFERYARLLPLIRTRSDLSDLIWEMQGELGTSHAYEMGGDRRKPPQYRLGKLGADLAWDEKAGGYRIERIIRGDSWDRNGDSPLAEPGLDVREGDVLVAVGGHAVSQDRVPDELLVNLAGREVALTIARGGDRRRVVVKTLTDEKQVRYRAWVEANRAYVHEHTQGRIGYVHIPDMGPWGYAEFHRGYLTEVRRAGLIVDARYNRGGHVSPLLLEKLARKRVGYDVPRYGMPHEYPPESVLGPMVALTNQFAGSDGDIFSHCFKLYKLGPLVGKRTWGGVIGIWPRHLLVDGTITTQPEFSFWFKDVGWNVENYGTDPDHDVDIAPHDYKAGRDPQMDKAIELILDAMAKSPPDMPDFSRRPNLTIPSSLPSEARR